MKPCQHPRCPDDECVAYTAEQVTPKDEDFEVAVRLIAEGWIQTSAKHRHVRRWAPPGPPSALEMIAPEFRDTPWGRRAVKAIERWVTSSGALHSEHAPWDITLYPDGVPRKAPPGEVGCYLLADSVEPNPLIEERTLTLRQFKAFKKLGGG